MSESLTHTKDSTFTVSVAYSLGSGFTGSLGYKSSYTVYESWKHVLTSSWSLPPYPYDRGPVYIYPGYRFRITWTVDERYGFYSRPEFTYYNGYLQDIGINGCFGSMWYVSGNCNYRYSEASGYALNNLKHDNGQWLQYDTCLD